MARRKHLRACRHAAQIAWEVPVRTEFFWYEAVMLMNAHAMKVANPNNAPPKDYFNAVHIAVHAIDQALSSTKTKLAPALIGAGEALRSEAIKAGLQELETLAVLGKKDPPASHDHPAPEVTLL